MHRHTLRHQAGAVPTLLASLRCIATPAEETEAAVGEATAEGPSTSSAPQAPATPRPVRNAYRPSNPPSHVFMLDTYRRLGASVANEASEGPSNRITPSFYIVQDDEKELNQGLSVRVKLTPSKKNTAQRGKTSSDRLAASERWSLLGSAFTMSMNSVTASQLALSSTPISEHSPLRLSAFEVVGLVVGHQASVLERVEPLKQLHSTFGQLCERFCAQVVDEVGRDGPAAVRRAMREEAEGLIEAIESTATVTGSSLSRHESLKRKNGAIEAVDTPFNVARRVGLELQLVQAWLQQAISPTRGENHPGPASATVAWWKATQTGKDNGAVAVEMARWMLARELLAAIHGSTFHIHVMGHGRNHGPRPLEAVTVRGIPALATFLLDTVQEKNAQQRGHEQDSATRRRGSYHAVAQESLRLSVHHFLGVYMDLLPMCALLRRVEGVQATPAEDAEFSIDDDVPESVEDSGDPCEVLERLQKFYIEHEVATRAEGAIAGVWWMHLLPLWISAAADVAEVMAVLSLLPTQSRQAHDISCLFEVVTNFVQRVLVFDREEYDRSRGQRQLSSSAQEEEQAAEGELEPLLRRRDKRSLFRQEKDGERDILTQTDEKKKSRFRLRNESVQNRVAALTPERGATASDVGSSPGALFHVLVMSQETPVILRNRYALSGANRSTALESAWLGMIHTTNRLWRLLYPVTAAAALRGEEQSEEKQPGRGGNAQPPAAQRTDSGTALQAVAFQQLPAPLQALVTMVRAQCSAAQAANLGPLLSVLDKAQQRVPFLVFDSARHITATVADSLLRIDSLSTNPVSSVHLPGAGRYRTRGEREIFSLHLAAGARELLLHCTSLWDGVGGTWKLLHQSPWLATRAPPPPLAPSSMRFSAQLARHLSTEAGQAKLRMWDNPDRLMTLAYDALATLKAARNGQITLTLDAMQATAVAVLRLLSVLTSLWNSFHSRERAEHQRRLLLRKEANKGTALDEVTAAPVALEDLLALQASFREALTLDRDLLLLCASPAFLTVFFDCHMRTDILDKGLRKFCDEVVLPTVLPAIVAGLHQSLLEDTAATHTQLCNDTLFLLASLSLLARKNRLDGFAVLEAEWSSALVQVCIYCTRCSGRGGLKQCTAYGLPDATLPLYYTWSHTPDSMAGKLASSEAPLLWKELFQHRSHVFLRLMHHSNILLRHDTALSELASAHGDGVIDALRAYTEAWRGGVSLPHLAPAPRTARPPATDDTALRQILQTLGERQAAALAWTKCTAPAVVRGAEVIPFMGNKAYKAKYLGNVVRFTEHFLRRQKQLSASEEDHSLERANAEGKGAGRDGLEGPGNFVDGAPLVLLDFVAHLSHGGSWIMVTWCVNIAETVVGLERRRHRTHAVESTQLAATALLSHLRVVPPPEPFSRIEANLLRSLVAISNAVCDSPISTFGFVHRNALQGILANPSRDEYRVLAFGLKQALLYLRIEAARYQQPPVKAVEAVDADDEEGEVPLPLLEENAAPGEVEEVSVEERFGAYYVAKRAAIVAAGLGEADAIPRAVEQFRFLMMSIVCATDANMQVLLLHLNRHATHGEEDVKDVSLAVFAGLSRSLVACVANYMRLPESERQSLFNEEYVMLLWTSIATAATVCAAARKDLNGTLFDAKATPSMLALIDSISQLVEAAPTMMSRRSVRRPLTTALVLGVQVLLNDKRNSRRVSIRFALPGMNRVDLTTMLTALQSIVAAGGSSYAPWRQVMLRLGTTLEEELSTSPDGTASDSEEVKKAKKPKKTRKTKKNKVKEEVVVESSVAHELAPYDVAATVPLRTELREVLKELCKSVEELRAMEAAMLTDEARAAAPPHTPLDIDSAVALVKEKPVAFFDAQWKPCVMTPEEDSIDDVLEADGEHPNVQAAPYLTEHHVAVLANTDWSVSEALEEGGAATAEVVDMVIARADALVVATKGHAPGSGDRTIQAAAMRSHQRAAVALRANFLDLLLGVPLAVIVTRPSASTLFRALSIVAHTNTEWADADEIDKIWSLLASKWKEEFLQPGHAAFLAAQAMHLKEVRSSRHQRFEADADMVRLEHPDSCANSATADSIAKALLSGTDADEGSVLATAQAELLRSYLPESINFTRHDDVGPAGSPPPSVSSSTAQVPLPVTLAILRVLQSMPLPILSRIPDEQIQALMDPYGAAAGGVSLAAATAGVDAHVVAFYRFLGVFLTHTARTYLLLRHRRSGDVRNAVELMRATMACYPPGPQRMEEWGAVYGMCLLPRGDEAAAVRNEKMFTEAQMERLASVLPADSRDGVEQMKGAKSAVPMDSVLYHYIRDALVYMSLTGTLAATLLRYRVGGDLKEARHSSVKHRMGGLARTQEVIGRIHELALARQTDPTQVNRNLLEQSILHYANVAWVLLRHGDVLAHASVDTAALLGARARTALNKGDGAAMTGSIMSYADGLRTLIIGTTQDTAHILVHLDADFSGRVTNMAVKLLLSSGLSCSPLPMAVVAADGSLMPLVSWRSVDTGRNASARTSVGTPKPAVRVRASCQTSLQRIAQARPELLVCSPGLLSLLTPQYVERAISVALQGRAYSTTLMPIVSSFSFYLSRRDTPLAPLLTATATLFANPFCRSSASNIYAEHLITELVRREDFRKALAPPTVASVDQGSAGSVPNDVLIFFLAVISRQDVPVSKKSLAQLLHTVLQARPDIFGQPPTANRQGKMTLVQVGNAIQASMDTTNPLYTPKRPRQEPHLGDGEAAPLDDEEHEKAFMAFHAESSVDVTATTHRKALAALALPLTTVVDVAVHMDAMRSLDVVERQRAHRMLKAADDARRERVAVHRSHVQAALQQGLAGQDASLGVASQLDASLHLEDPQDFGVAIVHLRYALRKIIHASLRRLLHQQGALALADISTLLRYTDPAMRATADGTPRPPDGMLAGTVRVLLSRAVLCAQGIGYDALGHPQRVWQPYSAAAASTLSLEDQGPAVLRPPSPTLGREDALWAALTASGADGGGSRKKRGKSADRTHTAQEEAIIQQKARQESEAAMVVGATSSVMKAGASRQIRGKIKLAKSQYTARAQLMKEQQQNHRRRSPSRKN